MAVPDENGGGLRDALETFARRINEDARMRKMVADWERTIALEASEGGGGGLRVRAGEVTVVDAPDAPDVVLRASGQVLADVFRGAVSPTEPYLDGTLTVQGSQEDVLRLDFLSLMIWGE